MCHTRSAAEGYQDTPTLGGESGANGSNAPLGKVDL